jgi:hypothetical protein
MELGVRGPMFLKGLLHLFKGGLLPYQGGDRELKAEGLMARELKACYKTIF